MLEGGIVSSLLFSVNTTTRLVLHTLCCLYQIKMRSGGDFIKSLNNAPAKRVAFPNDLFPSSFICLINARLSVNVNVNARCDVKSMRNLQEQLSANDCTQNRNLQIGQLHGISIYR